MVALLPPREWSIQWDKVTTCRFIADAKTCKAKEAFNCAWDDAFNYCYSNYWYECGKDTASMGCKIDAAVNASYAKTCAKLATKSACSAEDSCAWSSDKSACYLSPIGALLVYKQLGSKIATAFIAQEKTCTGINGRIDCVTSPPQQSAASSSWARGKACDWFGGAATPCVMGTEYVNTLYASADNDIDR
jgi:hypothetical protein